MKKTIIFLSFISIFASCVTQQRCNRKFPPETMIIRKDSIITKTQTIYRDTTILVYIPGEKKIYTDTIYIKDGKVYFKPSHLRTSFAESRAWLENGRFMHTLVQNDTTLSIHIKNAIRLTWKRAEKFYKEEITKVVKVKFVPLYYKVLSAIGLAALIYLSFQIRKKLKL